MTYSRSRSQTLLDVSELQVGTREDYSIYTPASQPELWGTATSVSEYTRGTIHNYIHQTMDDIVTPGYEKLSGQGGIVNNPLSKVETRYIDVPGWYRRGSATSTDLYYEDELVATGLSGWYCEAPCAGSFWFGGSPTSAPYPDVPSIDVDHYKQFAVTQAHANIDSSKAMLLATIGESKETVRSLVSIFKRAIKIFRAVKRLDTKALRKEISPKELSERYMEARYAIRPLIYDCAQIHAAATAEVVRDNRMTFRGHQLVTETESEKDELHFSSSAYKLYRSAQTKRTLEVRAGVLTMIDVASAPSIWGINQPIETMWELTSWSFIADWFFNIGQTIASWTPNVGIRTLASWCTTIDTIESTCWISSCEDLLDHSYYNGVAVADIGGCLCGVTTKTVTRTPDPQLSYTPTYNVRLNALKLLDLAIIGKALFFSKGKPVNAMYKRS